MLVYVLKRILMTIPVMLIVALFVFLMLRLSPGDPAAVIAGDYATAEDVARIREQLGLSEPIVVQFTKWIGALLQGDLGTSIFSNKPVAELIAQRIEPTLLLALTTILFSVAVAVPMGTLAAFRSNSWIDRVVMLFSVGGFSVPVFVLGYILIYFFALELRWLPVQGYRSPFEHGLGPFLAHITLPTLTLSVIFIALIARMTRASVIEVLEEDYIRTARAKGQSEVKVLLRHALTKCSCSHRHCHRHWDRPADRRCGGDRERLQRARAGAPRAGRGAGPGLPDHPRADPVFQLHLHPAELADRPQLHPA